MLRYKVFSGAMVADVEREVNTWLAHSQPDVKIMQQSVQPSGGIVVSFLYQEGFMVSEERLTEEASEIVEQALKSDPILEPIKVDQEQV